MSLLLRKSIGVLLLKVIDESSVSDCFIWHINQSNMQYVYLFHVRSGLVLDTVPDIVLIGTHLGYFVALKRELPIPHNSLPNSLWRSWLQKINSSGYGTYG
jgi:hypothetical protein